MYRVTGMGLGASWVQAISEASLTIIAATGLAIAGHQIRATNQDTETTRKMAEVDRTLELHRDFSTGSVGDARWRFIAFMHFLGESSMSVGRCYQPTWDQLLPPVGTRNDGPSNARGSLARYALEVEDWGEQFDPLHDLYTVLYYFKRVLGAIQHQTIEPELLKQLIGSHVEWWYVLCGKLTKDNSILVTPLISLASYDWGESESQRERVNLQFFGTANPDPMKFDGVLNAHQVLLPTRRP